MNAHAIAEHIARDPQMSDEDLLATLEVTSAGLRKQFANLTPVTLELYRMERILCDAAEVRGLHSRMSRLQTSGA